MAQFDPNMNYESLTTEIFDEYKPVAAFVENWSEAVFQATWGRLFQLSNPAERRAICEAHAHALDRELEKAFGVEMFVQIVPIDEPDGWRLMYQMEKYSDYMPQITDLEYTEKSGIHIDTDGSGD